jgi:hypothetical protein
MFSYRGISAVRFVRHCQVVNAERGKKSGTKMKILDPRIRKEHVARYGTADEIGDYLRTLEISNLCPGKNLPYRFLNVPSLQCDPVHV